MYEQESAPDVELAAQLTKLVADLRILIEHRK
jgi:hypothetical protein